MRSKKDAYQNPGFTLIELLVSIFIMLTLLGVVLANFTGLSGKRNLNVAKNNFISDIRRAQSQSLSSRDIQSGVVASTYGISFVVSAAPPSTYSSIADDNSAVPVRYNISSQNLPGNIYIKQISITRADNTVTTATNLQVLFTVPYGRLLQTYSGGATSANKDANATSTVTLSTSDNTQTITFVINGISGNITP